jgi:hypothetical protein
LQKNLYKIKHPLRITALIGLGIEEMYLNRIKDIYEKPIANIKISGVTLKYLPL